MATVVNAVASSDRRPKVGESGWRRAFGRAAVPAALLFLATGSLRAEKVVLVAGGGPKETDAPALECRLHEPFAVEFTPTGEMVVVEMAQGNRVWKQDGQGWLRIVAGNGGKGYGGDGGPALAASFNGLHNLAIPASGDWFLADSFNHVIRRIDARSGLISTFAGTGTKGFTGDGGLATAAQFSTLIQIALDPPRHRLVLADIGNRRIRSIDLATGTVSTLAGNGKAGVPVDGAEATQSSLSDPRAVVAEPGGGLYVLERGGNALRYVDAAGRIRTVAGTGRPGGTGDGGPAREATLSGPKHLCLDRDGTVIIADAESHLVRRYDPRSGVITRVAGTGTAGCGAPGGDPKECALRRPHGVTVGPNGLLYIVDSYNDRVLEIIP